MNSLSKQTHSTLFKLSKKNLNKTFRPTKYNLRLYYSNLFRNHQSFGRWESIYGPDGYEKTHTDRNPDNFKYKTNLWSHSIYELRHIYGDVLYQIIKRRHRLADPFMKYVLPSTIGALYLISGQHICFMLSFLASVGCGVARVFSKTEEPKLDEVWLYDFLLSHEEIKKHLKKGSFHVIDFHMEYEKGLENPLFPQFNTSVARMFNTDTNTTAGVMKLGDVETGSIVTVNFKTMPYSANQFSYSDPFLVYDMTAEVNNNGNIEVFHLIKSEDVLGTKKIFVPLF